MKHNDLRSGELYALRGVDDRVYKLRLLSTDKTEQRRVDGGWSSNSHYSPAYPAEVWNEERTETTAGGVTTVIPARWTSRPVFAKDLAGPWAEFEQEYIERVAAEQAAREAWAARDAEGRSLIMAFAARGFEVAINSAGNLVLDVEDAHRLLAALDVAMEVSR